jgi:acetylornithine deacetylase/succinyl-diaminopimelate desuccinylase-like protein
MRCAAVFLVFLMSAGLILAADRFPVDWDKTNAELMQHYTALLKIDTSNPPGNETRAVSYLKAALDREGIVSEVLALDPNRANLVARIKGNGSKRPVIVMGHTDVVGVQRENWPLDPFGAVRKDGYIFGRGTLDDKDNLSTGLMTMILLKRLRVLLDRDVILIAEAGEEGSTAVGIDFLVNKNWDKIAAEFALAEGGGGISREGKLLYRTIDTTEKVIMRCKLIARGTAGHGSQPRVDNAVVRLANAVSKVAAWQTPMRLNDTTRTYFERLAAVSSTAASDRYLHLSDANRTAEIQRYFAENELGHFSMLRTTITPTVLTAGFRYNVIPSQAEATLDIRALPDEDPVKFFEEMKRRIGDAGVEIVREPVYRPGSAPSRLDSEMFRALEQVTRELSPGTVTLPSMSTGASDKAQLRAKGVQAYGIGPAIDEKDRNLGGAHSDDERLLESELYNFMRFVWGAVTEIAASK